MILKILKKLFGSKNDRLLKKYSIILDTINYLEREICLLTDSELKHKFLNLNVYIAKDIDKLIPITFAIVREVSKRTINLRHFDVQILGGLALFDGKIAEIGTGEGKTLVATLPCCLYALLGQSTHLVTVNDYLAERDANWMRPIYQFLDLSVGIIKSGMSTFEKKNAYRSNVIYGTANEFAFDYLRDNMVFSLDDKVQSSGLSCVIIDEIDSILIDEARTPLIISAPARSVSNYYVLVKKLIQILIIETDRNVGDIVLDFKLKNVVLTDNGFKKVELFFKKYKLINEYNSLYDSNNIELLHIVYASLKAKFFFKKNIDYIVKNAEVCIIDEHTGRIMEGRRWGDGLHQAIEAKENLEIKSDNQTLASITFQNYFRLYKRLSGMTGTAITEANEFESIYGLDVLVVPSNKPNIRIDKPDLIFLTKKSKYEAIINDIAQCNCIGQPVLVGTISIDVSEFISSLLKKKSIKHNVLNAKYHDRESKIIAEAGRISAVTIATNMAGRGTDIVLGGTMAYLNKLNTVYQKIVSFGGLKVIGTERHESRRIDNQLRGRCARQGDPGCSQFYISLEDDLVRIFVGDKILSMLNKFNLADNEVISNSFITKSIENAQQKVESYNFDIRKQLLEYDDIVNEQRTVFYSYRDSIISCVNLSDLINDIFIDLLDFYFLDYFNNKIATYDIILSQINLDFGLNLSLNFKNCDEDKAKNLLLEKFIQFYNKRKLEIKFFDINFFEKSLFLNILDLKWKEHLVNLEYLKKGIYLRGYAQKDPKEEYKKESFFLFKSMLYNIKHEFVVSFFKIPFEDFSNKFISNNNVIEERDQSKFDDKKKLNHINFYKKNKIGRNEICYCGSNKKYKYCHGLKV